MAFYLENYGLDFLSDDDKVFGGFLAYLAKEGTPVFGYYGSPYFFKSTGTSEFWLKTERDEEDNLSITGVDSHSGGMVVWDLINSGIDITPENTSKLERIMMFDRKDGKGGLLPIDIINADVLPSFLEGDLVRLQVIALPLSINYYANEEEFVAAQPENSEGKKFMPAEGALLADRFLYNHSPERYEQGKNYESDSYVVFHATVKKLYHGTFETDEINENTYIRCIAETSCGELEFDHTYEQVPKELRKNMKEGAVISGVCVISGDAAIEEYENGAIKDLDHDLRLLRYSFKKGQAERLRSVLSKTATYASEVSNKTCVGPDEIIERISYVHENAKVKYQPHLATVTEADGLEYPVGTRCIAMGRENEEGYESIVFISVNEDGRIQKILTSNDSRYRFKVDVPEKATTPLDDLKIPDSVFEMIILRAKFHGIIDWAIEPEAIIKGISDYRMFEDSAQRMLDALQEEPQTDAEKALENIFGYLFAKAVEQKVNNSRNQDLIRGTSVSYYPIDAFKGEITSNLSKEEHIIIEKAMDLGKEFYKDFRNYIMLKEIGGNAFTQEFIDAAIIVQRIGQLGVQYFFK